MRAGDVGLNGPYVAFNDLAPVSSFMVLSQREADEIAYYVVFPFSLFGKEAYFQFFFYLVYLVCYLP
jgi:hypothetical protein